MAAYHCEHEFWTNHTSTDTVINEPLAASSGVFFILFGIIGTGGLEASIQPMRFCMARANMIFLGLGTCAYHTLTEEWLAASFTNRNLYDGMTTALFIFFLFLLFMNDWMLNHKFITAMGAMTYIYLWIVTNDTILFAELDRRMADQFGAAIQWPTLLLVCIYIFFRVAYRFGWDSVTKLHYPMWIALLVAVVSWTLDQFVCSLTRYVFFCHALWHASISYVAVYVTVLGVSMTYKDRFVLREECVWWPQLKSITAPSPPNETKSNPEVVTNTFSRFTLKIPKHFKLNQFESI